MPKPIRLTLLLVALAAIAAGTRMLLASEPGLVVHEWGTFTSIAGPNGQSVGWRPVSGPQDLPCFVTELTARPGVLVKGPINGNWLQALNARVRMETPVLYFYSPKETTVDVQVTFPKGLVTEWYPKATVPAPGTVPYTAIANGAIAWTGVKVTPAAQPAYLKESAASHYYAARSTDAAPVQVGAQWEKFLFYRGIGDFAPPLAATVDASGALTIDNNAQARALVVFENRRGRIGYRIERSPAARLVVSPPALTGTMTSLQADLKALLVAEGLYAREAAAMVDTWRDSWFEEGTRIFYVMPQAVVDRILPLTITPAPAQVARAFVGRLEVVTAAMYDEVEHALLANDLDTLNRYGRFLEPIAVQVAQRPSLAGRERQISRALAAVVASHPPRSCQ